MSLIKKIFFTVAVIAAATMVALLYFGLTFMRSAVHETAATQQVKVAHETLQNIDQVLYVNYQGIQTAATSHAVAGIAKQPGSVALQKEVAGELKAIAPTTGAWETLEVVGMSGKVVGAADEKRVGTAYPADKEPFRTVFEKAAKGQTAYGDAFIHHTTGKPTMLFASPIRDDGNAERPVQGVLVGYVAWASVLEPLQNAENKGVAFKLYNRHGMELGGSKAEDQEKILKNEAKDNEAVQNAVRGLNGSLITASTNSEQEMLVSYVPEKGFRGFGGNNWALTAEISTGEAYVYANKLGQTLPFIFAGIIFIGVLSIMLVLNRIIVQHVKTLTATTQNIATGDLSQRIHINSHDELGQLGQSFNRMADKLQEVYRGLEAKVAQKTAQLAERVKESETARARDEAILAGMGEGLIALDEKGLVALVNQRAAELFDMPRDTLFGRPLEQSIPELHDEQDKELAPGKRPEVVAKTTMEPTNEVYTFHLQDGGKLAISINATPIMNEKKVVGIVLVVRDVTHEKEVDRMKTEFISLASHQLRTPLSAIRWFSEMLVSGDAGKLNAEQQEFAQNVYDSTERMIALVSSLLNISRIESGRIMIDPKPTDVKELVSGIVNDLRAKIEERKQNLVISVHDGLPKINLDPRLISQVYMNFLTNAIKYTPKGGEVSVFVSRKGDDLVSQITDNGYGIPKKQQGKLFQKFFRAENVTKIETDGTGLGLYLVKAIIESSGGKVWFESEEGKGTTFWFSLPMSGMKAKEGEVTLDM